MHFVIICRDKPDHQQVRADTRPTHVAYLKEHAAKIVAAGPTLTEDGEAMNGSVLVMEFDDRAAAEAWAAGDPYAKAGLFESTEILPWRKVFPADG